MLAFTLADSSKVKAIVVVGIPDLVFAHGLRSGTVWRDIPVPRFHRMRDVNLAS